MVRMVVTDLDNTLFRSDSTLSAYAVDVLRRCRARGIKVVYATARSAQAASRYLALFSPDVFIGYGGALALAGDEVICRIEIPPGTAARLIEDCMAAPEVSSIHAINESVTLTSDLRDMENRSASHYRYTNFSHEPPRGYLKVSLTATDQAAVERIAARYPMCDMLRYTGEDLYRFANRNAVKWNAVKAVARHNGVGTDECVAFGDDVNDVEMLANCGTGVAVANAIDAAKAAAGHICDLNDDDGVAHWLEKHVLQA